MDSSLCILSSCVRVCELQGAARPLLWRPPEKVRDVRGGVRQTSCRVLAALPQWVATEVFTMLSASRLVSSRRVLRMQDDQDGENSHGSASLQNELIERWKQTKKIHCNALYLNHVQNSFDVTHVPRTHTVLHPGLPFLDGRSLSFLSFTATVVLYFVRTITEKILVFLFFFLQLHWLLPFRIPEWWWAWKTPPSCFTPSWRWAWCCSFPAWRWPWLSFWEVHGVKLRTRDPRRPAAARSVRFSFARKIAHQVSAPKGAMSSHRDQGFQLGNDRVYSFPDFAANPCQPTSYNLSDDSSPTETCACVHCFPDLKALSQGHDRPLRAPSSPYPYPVLHRAHVQNGGPVLPEGATTTTEGDAQQESLVG